MNISNLNNFFSTLRQYYEAHKDSITFSREKKIFFIVKVVELGSANVHFLVVSSNATISNGKSSPMAKLLPVLKNLF